MMSLPAHLEVHFIPESVEHDQAVEAIFATCLVAATPTLQVIPTS